MENRRIYLPPIQDMLNRSNTYVEQDDDDNCDQSQVMNGYETHFTSTQISSSLPTQPQTISATIATKATKVNKSNFNGQLFNTLDIKNKTHPHNAVPKRELSSVDERTYHYNNSPSSSYTSPSSSSPSSPNHSELLQMDIPKYRSPHSRSYSDHFLHNNNDHDSRPLLESLSPSSSMSRSPPPISPLQQQQQQQHVNNNNQYYKPVTATTIFQHSQHPRYSHPRQHRRATSDITPFPQEQREYTTNHVRYKNNDVNRGSLDEDVIILSQQQEFSSSSSSPPPSSSSPPPSSATSNTHSNRYQCSQCSKTFSRPSSLRIHIFSHTGEKPHVCPHPGCGRRFSVQSNMRRHLKVHYCGPQSQKDQNYLGKLPLNGDSQSSNLFISEGGSRNNSNNNGSSGGSDFYRYSSVSRA